MSTSASGHLTALDSRTASVDSILPCKYRRVRIVVIGAGAIGAPIAAQLSERGHTVVLVARGANYDAIAAEQN
jgi:cation diffusion facilitator CzcD-associated flavoprotein CzcO